MDLTLASKISVPLLMLMLATSHAEAGESHGSSAGMIGEQGAESSRPEMRDSDEGPNRATIVQDGSGGNVAIIRQAGTNNVARQTQSGKRNKALVEQDGRSNSVEQSQSGTSNLAESRQEGDRNEVSQAQAGRRHEHTAVITGSGVTVSIQQHHEEEHGK